MRGIAFSPATERAPSGLGGFGRFVAEGGLLALLHLAVADADEFQDRPRAGIAQARLGQADDAGVAAVAARETAERPRSSRTLTAVLSPSSWIRRRREATAGAMAAAHFFHLSLFRQSFQARRCSARPRWRARLASSTWSSALQASVMHFSTSGRTSLALCSVVTIRPLTLGALSSSSASRSVRNSALAMFLSRPCGGWESGRGLGLFDDDAWRDSDRIVSVSEQAVPVSGPIVAAAAPACPGTGPGRAAFP